MSSGSGMPAWKNVEAQLEELLARTVTNRGLRIHLGVTQKPHRNTALAGTKACTCPWFWPALTPGLASCSGQAMPNVKGMRVASSSQEVTMLLQSPMYTTFLPFNNAGPVFKTSVMVRRSLMICAADENGRPSMTPHSPPKGKLSRKLPGETAKPPTRQGSVRKGGGCLGPKNLCSKNGPTGVSQW